MPEIARLDDTGVLIGVESCTNEDHKTDPFKKTVRLENGHDVRRMLKGYRWDFHQNTFLPLSMEPLAVAERDVSELTDGIVEALEDISAYLQEIAAVTNDSKGKKLKKIKLSPLSRKTLSDYRRLFPRKKRASRDTDTVTVDFDCVVVSE